MRRQPEQAEQDHAQLGGDRLQERNEFLPKRHQKQRIGQREQEAPSDRLSENSHHAALNHNDKTQMAGGCDARRFADKPTARAQGYDGQTPRRYRRLQLCQFIPAIPDQPTDDRQDQQAMIEC